MTVYPVIRLDQHPCNANLISMSFKPQNLLTLQASIVEYWWKKKLFAGTLEATTTFLASPAVDAPADTVASKGLLQWLKVTWA